MTSLIVGRLELAKLLSISVATLDRMHSAGKIGPPEIKVSAGRIGWRFDSIRDWIDESERRGELIGRHEWLEMKTAENCNGQPHRK